MIVVMLPAFLRAHATHLFADQHVLIRNFRLALEQPGSLQTDVGAITVKFDATRQQRDVVFIQACRFTIFAGDGTLYQLLLKLAVRRQFVGFGDCIGSHSHSVSHSGKILMPTGAHFVRVGFYTRNFFACC
jgi:hypothetical protein